MTLKIKCNCYCKSCGDFMYEKDIRMELEPVDGTVDVYADEECVECKEVTEQEKSGKQAK